MNLFNYSFNNYKLNLINKIIIDDDNSNIALSIDWNKNNGNFVISDSKGFISIYDINGNKISKWKAHDLYGSPIEAWICNYNKIDYNIVYTGADDTYMKSIF